MDGIEPQITDGIRTFTDAPLGESLDATISPDIRMVRINDLDDLEASLERGLAAAERVRETIAEHEGDLEFRVRLERVRERERELRDRLAS